MSSQPGQPRRHPPEPEPARPDRCTGRCHLQPRTRRRPFDAPVQSDRGRALLLALFVNPDGSLMGTILDADNQWNGAQSAPNVVQPGRWHQAELRHDGINECLIFLDGVQVGAGYGAPGQVRSVGPNGVAVGHLWPEPPGSTLWSAIFAASSSTNTIRPTPPRACSISCCIKRDSLDELADRLRTKGYTVSGRPASNGVPQVRPAALGHGARQRSCSLAPNMRSSPSRRSPPFCAATLPPTRRRSGDWLR